MRITQITGDEWAGGRAFQAEATGRRLGREELRAGSRAEKMLRSVEGWREGERGDMRRGRGTRGTEPTVTEGRAGRGRMGTRAG